MASGVVVSEQDAYRAYELACAVAKAAYAEATEEAWAAYKMKMEHAKKLAKAQFLELAEGALVFRDQAVRQAWEAYERLRKVER